MAMNRSMNFLKKQLTRSDRGQPWGGPRGGGRLPHGTQRLLRSCYWQNPGGETVVVRGPVSPGGHGCRALALGWWNPPCDHGPQPAIAVAHQGQGH